MALEDTLDELTQQRAAFRARRARIDEEVRKLRAERLAAEQAMIEMIIVKAMVEGATLGQIKRAYGTKDHRTISDIVTSREAEIQAMRDAREAEIKATEDWFKIRDNGILVTIGEHEALFTYTYVGDVLMFMTTTPLWNDDFTTKNEAVALLDGKTETDCEEARVIVRAINEQG